MKNITLEMSLKPFKQTDDKYIENVCKTVFTHWIPLLKKADTVSVMLWAADGSEILDYTGDMDKSFEWAYLIGGANPKENKRPPVIDPNETGLHTRNYLYIENPPVMTYRILNNIIKTINICFFIFIC